MRPPAGPRRKAFWAPRVPEDVSPTFRSAMEGCLADIPRGKVATCGAIAKALGDVRAARSVATWLLEHPDVPGAHRVVRADGRPVIADAERARTADGVSTIEGRVAELHFIETVAATPILTSLREEQRGLAAMVSEEDETGRPRTFGGVDVAYAGDHAFAAAVVLDAETLETQEAHACELEVDFPYIPTFLAFREFPAVRAAVEGLRAKPDVLFVDGHGRLHPALFGFACFAGVRLDLPTIGVAKHPLAGRAVPAAGRVGGAVPIELDGRVRGYAWAPPGGARPFYVSVGHRVCLPTALATAQRATRRKYPEPLLVADRLSKERKVKKNLERSASGRTAHR